MSYKLVITLVTVSLSCILLCRCSSDNTSMNTSFPMLEIKLDKKAIKKLEEYDKWTEGEIKLGSAYYPTKIKRKEGYCIKLKTDTTYLNNFKRFRLQTLDKYDLRVHSINYLANKIGLISTFGELQNFTINDTKKELFYVQENIDKEFFEREFGITNYSIIIDKSSSGVFKGELEDEEDDFKNKALKYYQELGVAVKNKNIKEISYLVDLDYISNYIAFSRVVNQAFSIDISSPRFIYDFSRGKFYFDFLVGSENGDKLSLFKEVSELLLEDSIFSNAVVKKEKLYQENMEGLVTSLFELIDEGKKVENYPKVVGVLDAFKLKTGFDIGELISISNINQDSTLSFLDNNNITYKLPTDDSLVIQGGTYVINYSFTISSKYKTYIQKGTTFEIAANQNVAVLGNITIAGTEDQPVIVKAIDNEKPYGCFAILGEENNTHVNINYLNVSGGGESYYAGRLYTGQFAIYNADVVLKNSKFTASMGDDGLNVKYSRITIDSCSFINNMADQVDLDFCMAKVSNSVFSPSTIDDNGDGLDLSGSYALVSNCNYTNFMDKGLSLGEKSKVLVNDCSFRNNKSGITVKDETVLYSWANTFENNEVDYLSYIKKGIFNDPNLYIDNTDGLKVNLIQGNKHSFTDIDNELRKFQRIFTSYRSNTYVSNKQYLGTIITGAGEQL